MNIKLWLTEIFTKTIVASSSFLKFILHSKNLILLLIPASITGILALIVSEIIGKIKRNFRR